MANRLFHSTLVELALKPHGPLNATGPTCRKAIQRVGHRNFRLWYDPGNIFAYSNGALDPVDDAATVDGLVTGMCIKDYDPAAHVKLTPGTGQVDFRRVLTRLREGGFRGGPLVIETLAPGDPDSLVREARKARKFVRRPQCSAVSAIRDPYPHGFGLPSFTSCGEVQACRVDSRAP